MASTSTSTSESRPHPIINNDPVKYLKLVSEEGPNQHIFICDLESATRFSASIRELVHIEQTFQNESALQDDTPSSSSSSSSSSSGGFDSLPSIEFREIPKRSLETCVSFFYWKKRWCHVVTERIPDFTLPTEKNLALNTLIAANELRC